MRLSRALLVMLLLHVVAVGGFLASSMLRDRAAKRSSSDTPAVLEAEDSQVPAKGESAGLRKTPVMTDPRPGVHVVRPGDTLTLIANQNGVTLEALVAANGADTVTNGLKTGQELRLPTRSPDPATANLSADGTSAALNQIEGHAKVAATPAVTNAKPKGATPESGKTYVVAKGDNLVTIAQKNKISAQALMKLNGIDDPKKLQPGQKLRLPLVVAAAKPKGK